MRFDVDEDVNVDVDVYGGLRWQMRRTWWYMDFE